MKKLFTLVALGLAIISPSFAFAKGGVSGGGSGSGGNGGCAHIQSLTADIGPRFEGALTSLNTSYATKACDKNERIAVRTVITEVPTGTSLLDYTQAILIGQIFTYANFIPGATYTVRIDVVDTRSGSALESRTVSAVAPF